MDWILAYAYQYINLVPEVTLTGYIKAVTKTKREKILKHPRRCQSEEVVRKQIEAIESLPAEEL